MRSATRLEINFLPKTAAFSRIKLPRPWLIAGAVFSVMLVFSLAAHWHGGADAKSAARSFNHLPILADKPAPLAEKQPAKPIAKPIAQASAKSRPKQIIQGAITAQASGLDLPMHLSIPKINVQVAIEPVGLTPDGSIALPKGRDNAAWFKLGPRPGDGGSAVITGHYGFWKDGGKTVFNDLSKLASGDKLYVKDEKSDTVSFVVRASKTYDQNADAESALSSNNGQPRLVLVTCAGEWNKTSKSYSQRLVVFADKEQ